MRQVAGTPWVLFAIRIALLLIIPGLLLLVPSEGGSAGYALWWGGIMCVALFIVHWRDWSVSIQRGLTVYLGGALVCFALCYGAWFLGRSMWGIPSAEFDFAYPSVSAGINEMILAGHMGLALLHLFIETTLLRKAG